MSDANKTQLRVFNPLGSALTHYGVELGSISDQLRVDVHLESYDEPASSLSRRFKWVFRVGRFYLRQRWTSIFCRTGDRIPTIVVWPALGYLDLIGARLAGRGTYVVLHDPVPMVRSAGYDTFSKMLARRLGSSRVIVHSTEAASVIQAQLKSTPTILPHPMSCESIQPPDRDRRPKIVRVLGQYKKTRDTRILETLGRSARMSEYKLEIIGRGWPAVDKWDVSDTYLEECSLTEAIRTASVVLIPYTRFYQSGIAVRCVELGTPVVGPRTPFMEQLIGQSAATLVSLSQVQSQDSWAKAIDSALAEDPEVSKARYRNYKNFALSEWAEWLKGASVG